MGFDNDSYYFFKMNTFKKQIPKIVLILILIIAGYLRLYRIRDYMGFLGDEGRDVLVVKRMIVDHDFTLLGPITSVGLMHLGPIYYYFMIPFLWATNLDPVGPAIMVAMFSLGTILLIWQTCREFINLKCAGIASLLYALSPFVITHAHSSWNPNILPFWALLFIYSLLKVLVDKKSIWLFGAGISLGVSLQLHYLALIFIPILGASLLILKFKVTKSGLYLLILGWLSVFFPFILFEFKHKFINSLTVLQFTTRTGTSKTFGLTTFFPRIWDLSVRLFWRPLVVEDKMYAILLLLCTLGFIGYAIVKKNSKIISRPALLLLIIWYAVGLGILSFYTGNIYDYYLMFVLPLPFIIVGIALSYISQRYWGKIITGVLILVISYYQLKYTPIAKEPNRLAFQAKQIADFILTQTNSEPYNFAMIAGQNSDHAYRYFLEIDGRRPVIIKNEIDDLRRESVMNQLFVVCEEKICKPLGHPLWEIAGFGRAEIESEWQVGLFKVFKLVRYVGS